MRNAEQLLTQYAACHRDQRNVATHFVGVPMIVFSVVLALAQFPAGSIHLGWLVIAAGGIYYLWLDRALGLATFGFLIFCGVVASLISAKTSGPVAMGLAAAPFIGGWIIQFIGHKYEGVKPAFVDDLTGLAIGPLFVMAELFFLFGLKPDLRRYIEDRVGVTMPARDGRPIGPADRDHTADSANFNP